jgi:uncharacterized protein
MHINVRDILAESVGYSRAYKVSGERPSLEEVKLTHDIEGEITVSRLDDSLLVRGQVQTEIELECHRCLRTFTRPVKINVAQEYADTPGDDQMPIEDNAIDIAPLIEQEIVLSLPIKVLCKPDCPGMEDMAGKYTISETKGIKRGRT